MDNVDSCEPLPPTMPEQFGACFWPARAEQPGLFRRIFDTFSLLKTPPEAPKVRKICCHEENADQERRKLEKLKEEFQRELDEEMMPIISEVIDPILRKVERISRPKKQEGEDPDLSAKFMKWTEEAKLWVELLSNNKDKEAIKIEIVKHTITKSGEQIERDIRFIESYLKQHLEQLDPEARHEQRVVKTAKVFHHISKLRSLQKQKLPEISFEEVSAWRQNLDEQRAKHHNAALQAIDS